MRRIQLARLGSGAGEVAKPGSAATITLWDAAEETRPNIANLVLTNVIVRIRTSHASATGGLKFLERQSKTATGYSLDATGEKDVAAASAAAPYVVNTFAVSSQYPKVTFENSANVLTAWEGEVIGEYL